MRFSVKDDRKVNVPSQSLGVEEPVLDGAAGPFFGKVFENEKGALGEVLDVIIDVV